MLLSKGFNDQIKQHLDKLAAADPLFAETLKKPNKNILDCGKYILNEVQRLNVNGMADAEVFALAVHYYDEDDIKISPLKGNVKVVVNHVVELTDEEKAEAKQKALNQAIAKEQERLTKKPAKKVEQPTANQVSLF